MDRRYRKGSKRRRPYPLLAAEFLISPYSDSRPLSYLP